jgi:molybdopterin-guanine dinucleotide biosynthesis protein A
MLLVTKEQDPIVGEVCGAILAGGQSKRFGDDKALVLLGKKRLIEHGLDLLRSIFREVLIITNQPRQFQFLDVPIACDVIQGAGSLGGILTALVHARADRCFIVACDMPFVNRSIVRLLYARADRYDVVVPIVNGEPEPLHALYSKRCISPIVKRILEKDYRIINFYKRASTLRVEEEEWAHLDPEGLSFVNINTPADFQNAFERIRSKE